MAQDKDPVSLPGLTHPSTVTAATAHQLLPFTRYGGDGGLAPAGEGVKYEGNKLAVGAGKRVEINRSKSRRRSRSRSRSRHLVDVGRKASSSMLL